MTLEQIIDSHKGILDFIPNIAFWNGGKEGTIKLLGFMLAPV